MSGEPLEHHVDPLVCLGAASDRIFVVFLGTSARNLSFHHVWVGKRRQKGVFSGEADVPET